MSFYKFFEFLIYSKHHILNEFYNKNISILNKVLEGLKFLKENKKNNLIPENENEKENLNNNLFRTLGKILLGYLDSGGIVLRCYAGFHWDSIGISLGQ